MKNLAKTIQLVLLKRTGKPRCSYLQGSTRGFYYLKGVENGISTNFIYFLSIFCNRNGGRMKKICLFFLLCLFAVSLKANADSFDDSCISLPRHEKALISSVADEYKLEGGERLMLYVIRKIENGGVSREFGVLSKEAMRHKDDALLSFITQARWAAGTIKKRFNKDLIGFANRYCPVGAKNDPTGLNNNWYKNAVFYLQDWKESLEG